MNLPLRILLIGDPVPSRQSFRSRLEALGCMVCESDNAADALVTARAFQPEAFVLDYALVTMRRAAVAWHLASDPVAGRLPTAFCTWHAENAARAALPPRLTIFSKPCDSAELGQWLHATRQPACAGSVHA